MAAAAADIQPRCMRLFEDHSIISCHVPGQGASEREDFCLMCSKRAYGYNEHIGSTVHQKNLRNWWSSESGQTRVQKLKWIFQSKDGPCEKHAGYVAKDIFLKSFQGLWLSQSSGQRALRSYAISWP